VRFAIGLRGYRMDQVDDVLDRLGRELAARDDRIAALEQRGHDSDSRSNGGADE
jgi:DivIVA domain-containing protein